MSLSHNLHFIRGNCVIVKLHQTVWNKKSIPNQNQPTDDTWQITQCIEIKFSLRERQTKSCMISKCWVTLYSDSESPCYSKCKKTLNSVAFCHQSRAPCTQWIIRKAIYGYEDAFELTSHLKILTIPWMTRSTNISIIEVLVLLIKSYTWQNIKLYESER